MISETLMSETGVAEETPPAISDGQHKEMPSEKKMVLLKPISVTSQIYTWQPTGLRVVIDLPVVGNDKSFLFTLRNHPLILTPGMCTFYFQRPCSVYGNLFPLRHSTANSEEGYTYSNVSNSSITFVQHSPPPLATWLALSHARWRGGISWQFRTTSQFTNQANCFVTKFPAINEDFAALDGQTVPCDDGTDQPAYTQTVEPILHRMTWYQDTFQASSFVNADLAVQRHVEIDVPFELPVPCVDTREMVRYGSCTSYLTSQCNPVFNQHVAFGLKGGIDAGSGPQQISFEIYMKLNPLDTQFANFMGLPYFLAEFDQIAFMDDYNMAPGKNSITKPNTLIRNNVTTWWNISESTSSVAPPTNMTVPDRTRTVPTITPTTTTTTAASVKKQLGKGGLVGLLKTSH